MMVHKEYIENKITSDDARRYFWNNGLTYEKALTKSNIEKLTDICNDHICQYNIGYKYPYFLRVIDYKTELIEGKRCSMVGKGDYFAVRQLISFEQGKDTNTNNPHWIGFAGAADTNNVQPILRAFMEWVDWLKGQVAK